jgi:glycerophosphoryl diester phosphodiesterase
MPPVFDDPPVLCGHRGSGRGSRENTMESYLDAVEAGLDWVEVDARVTADGVLVARHDPDLEDGRLVAEVAADETGLMRVAALLEELPPEIAVNVDVKTSLEDALRPPERTTAALVADLVADVRRRVLVTSFDPAALLIAREVAPVGLLTWMRFPLRKAIPAAVHLVAAVVAAHVESFQDVERDVSVSIRVAHDAGLQVAAWCPRPDEAEQLVAAGVDCLVVDDVLRMVTPR